MDKIIYFNHASAGLMPVAVVSAVTDYLAFEQQYGAQAAERHFSLAQKQLYHDLAQLIHATADEIAVFDSATAASIALIAAINWQPNDRVLITPLEYGSLYLAWQQLVNQKKISLDVLPLVDQVTIDIDVLKRYLTAQHRLVSLPIVASHGGCIKNLAAVTAWLQTQSCDVLLDAAQAVGQVPVDLEKTPCDFLVATARKYLKGPRGCGFLYVKQASIAHLTPCFAHLATADFNADYTQFKFHHDAKILEYGENSYAIRYGFQQAVQHYLQQNAWAHYQSMLDLVDYFTLQLTQFKSLKLLACNQNTGILCYQSTHLAAASLCQQLSEAKPWPIYCTAWPAMCSPLLMRDLQQQKLVRFSLSYQNTKAEIDYLVGVFKKLIQ